MRSQKIKPSRIERFNAKWKPDADGCHIWTACQYNDGYGMFQAAGRKPQRAHRWIFEYTHGFLPPVVMHRCDKPLCVRVECLQAGTVAENNADRQRKGRSSDRRGQRCPTSKLTDEHIRQIRALWAAGETSQQALGGLYGVTQTTISSIVNRKSWSHV